MTVRPGDVASALGKGVVAGAVGTAVLTAAQRIEMALSGREESSAPAEAVEKVLDLEPGSERAEARLSQLTHWAYGTGWGAVRGLLAAAGLKGPAATLTHFGLVWGAALGMMPALDLAPPATEWEKEQVLKDAGFHALYAVATGLAYAYLENHE
jgi:hypothetical protein